MKKSHKITAIVLSSILIGAPLAACAGEEDLDKDIQTPEITEGELGNTPEYPPISGEFTENNNPSDEEAEPPAEEPEPEVVPPPVKTTARYIRAESDGVNIRSGAGTGYSARGTTQKSTLYAYDGGAEGGWYSTSYKHSKAYVSSKYFTVVEMQKSDNPLIEEIIAVGLKCLGVEYVYGAVRLHNGKGVLYKSFKKTEFDCSSLMQYIFYYGANINLDVNTRTQIYQGKTVKKSQLKRGDLMFFTNASRKHLTGVERVGHVALYLGDNWILHTASDYAKIEQISATRWSYFIQGQRIL